MFSWLFKILGASSEERQNDQCSSSYLNSTRCNNTIQESLIEQKDYHHTQQISSFNQQKEGEDEDEQEANRLSIASSVLSSSDDSQRVLSKEYKPPSTIKQFYNNTCSAETNTISASNDLPSTKKHEAASNRENKHSYPSTKRKHSQYQTASSSVTITKQSARLAAKRRRIT